MIDESPCYRAETQPAHARAAPLGRLRAWTGGPCDACRAPVVPQRRCFLQVALPNFVRAHYEKVVCACCFLFLFVNMGFSSTSFGVYQPYIAEVVGDTAGSLVLACRTLSSLVCMLFVDRFYARLDCRTGVFAASMLTAAGFAAYAAAHDLAGFCLGALLSGAGYGLGGMVCMTTLVSRWFRDHVGTAVGVASAGSGMASLLVSPTVARIVAASSLSTAFLCEAGAAALIGVVVFALLRNRPQDIGAEPFALAQAGAGGTPHKPGHSRTAAQAAQGEGVELPRGAFAAMLVAMTFMGVLAIDGMGYLSILFTSTGIDRIEAATLVAVAGGCLTVSKALSGKVFDLVGVYRGSAAFFCVLLAGYAMCCLMGTGSAATAWAAAILSGCGISLGTVGISLWSLKLSTPRQRARVIKDFQVAYALGGFLFNFVPGTLMDLCGSYVLSYDIMAALAVACAAVTLVVYRRYAGRD